MKAVFYNFAPIFRHLSCNKTIVIMRQVIYTSLAPAPIGPYSQAIKGGGLIFISGQIAINPDTGMLIDTDDIKEETKQVMQNLEAILKEAGSNLSKVLKCSIFLIDMGQFTHVNEVYGSYFQEEPPARETVEVSGLPKGVRVEISAIALP
jgi:2-iminobutanoate/2-iminopropanoate deaminase